MDDRYRATLLEVLAEGQRRGLLGPGPLEPHVDHALAVGAALADTLRAALGARPGDADADADADANAEAVRALDLGTGGGVPGLVLAGEFPRTRWVLLDSRRRSTAFVEEAVVRLGLVGRVTVLLGRAEEVGRDPAHRGRYDVVVARGFGPPAVTAECGAPLLRVGGRLVVTEPPGGDPARWPAEPLARLGLRVRPSDQHQQVAVAVLEQVEPAPSTIPRRTGIPTKRPLFSVSRETETST